MKFDNHTLATFDLISDAIFICDGEGNLIHVNQAACERTGYSSEELLRIGLSGLRTPENQAKAIERIRKLSAEGELVFETAYLRKDGTIIPFELNIKGVDFNGKPAFLGVARDITEKKRRESELRLSEQKFSKTFHDSPDPMIITELETGRTIEVNRSFTETFGYSQDEVIGRTTVEFGLWTDKAARLETISRIRKQGSLRDYELQHRTKDGRILTLLGSATQLHSGWETLLVIHFRDITARKAKEAELAAITAEKLHTLYLLQAIANGSTDAIFAKDMDGRYILCNQETLRQLGKRREDVIGKTDREIYPDAVAAAIRENDLSALRWASPITFEETLDTVDGARTFLTTKGPMQNENGDPFGTFGISHDITDIKRTEQLLSESVSELEKKEAAKTRFLAAAGHDLRQPLAAATLFVDALKLTSLTREQGEIVQRLSLSMGNFNDLLDALLNVSKLDAGMVKPDYTAIKVAEIFSWLEQSFSAIARQKGLSFRLFTPSHAASHVWADYGLLRTVLMNLVANAIKFTSHGGVLVSARPRGNQILFQIWDTGIGIPQDRVEKIFEEFYQVENPQRDRTRGLGLGLAIVKRALSLIEGKIVCRSRMGRGSVFEFRLRVAAAPRSVLRPPAAASASPSEQAAFVRGRRFVVVEDDKLVAEALTRAIKAMQGDVECFHSAEDALNRANIERADYYIVDYMLSGSLSGMDFLNQVRRKAHKSIRAVMMTGDTSGDFMHRAEYFEWPVIHKPADADLLVAKLIEQELHV